MKKFLSFLFALLIACMLPVTAFAEDTYTEGTLYYTIHNGSITITGCFGKDATVTVPSTIAGIPVNTIAAGAFSSNEYVTSVILPDTITGIEDGAFGSGVSVTQTSGSGASGSSSGTTGETGSGTTVSSSGSAGTANSAGATGTTGSSGTAETSSTAASTGANSSTQSSVSSGSSAYVTSGTSSYATSGNSASADTAASPAAFEETDVILDEEELEAESRKAVTSSADSSVLNISASESSVSASSLQNTVEGTQENHVSILSYLICDVAVLLAVVGIFMLAKKLQPGKNNG